MAGCEQSARLACASSCPPLPRLAADGRALLLATSSAAAKYIDSHVQGRSAVGHGGGIGVSKQGERRRR